MRVKCDALYCYATNWYNKRHMLTLCMFLNCPSPSPLSRTCPSHCNLLCVNM